MNYLIDSIKQHEGFKTHAYLDTKFVPTIGFGRAFPGKTLEQVQAMFPEGVTAESEEAWLEKALDDYRKDAWGLFITYSSLSPERQDVLVELAYNLGAHKLARFKRTIANVTAGKYGEAGIELCDSGWWVDVKPRRALHLATQLVTGQRWQTLFP